MIYPKLCQRRARLLRFLSALMLVALMSMISSSATAGQSGRRTPGGAKPGGATTPSTTPEPSTGESESQSKTKKPKTETPPALSLIVCEMDNPFLDVAYISPSQIIDAFAHRLSESDAVSVVRGPKLSRQEVRARAKNERDAYVVLVQLEHEAASSGREPMGQVNPRSLILRYYVYTPQTGDLKLQDQIIQRPYRQTATIGGVRVPLPTRQTPIPTMREMEQLARDAADRLMIRFHVRVPPEN